MDNEFKQFLTDLTKAHSRAIVGRLMKQIEIIQEKDFLNSDQKLQILKDFNKELIYEEFRDLRNAAIFYLEGRTYKKYPIYNPNQD